MDRFERRNRAFGERTIPIRLPRFSGLRKRTARFDRREPTASTVIHGDQGTPFCSWAFTRRAQESGLLPSVGAVGSCFDNALMEAFWSRVQVELLDRQTWRTRLQLANALFEYLEIFHNRTRRHSALGMLTPVEFEARQTSAGPISAA
jgi:transposase InsO family protein